jgi:hypothetical protein
MPSHRPFFPRRGLSLLFLILCGLSCAKRDELNPVQGKVLYKGQPLKGALVTFHAKGADELTTIRPVGLTKDDGAFTLMSGEKNGAPAGDYVITIICSEMPKTSGKAISTGGIDTQDRLQGAYAERAASKITATIKAGPNQLEPFDLK